MSDWPIVELGSVVEIVNGATPDTKDKSLWGGPHQWITPAEMGNRDLYSIQTTRRTLSDKGLAACSAQLVPKHSVILSSRAPIGYVVINEVPMATNQGCKSLIPNESLDFRYLFYFLKSRVKKLNEMGTGTTFSELSTGKLKTISIPMPSVDEQHRVVVLIDNTLAKIRSAQARCSKGTAAYHEYLEAEREEIFTAAAENYGSEALSSVLDIARGGSPRPIKSFLTTADDGINWVKISDATKSEKYIYFTDQRIKPEGLSHSRLVQSGDFLLSNSMSFGRPYIMRTTGAIHDGWLVLRDTNGRLNENYLYYLLGSAYIYREFNKLAAGSTVRNLNISLAGSVRIPVPPLEEQVRIEARIAECERAGSLGARNSEERWQRLSELREAVLHKAFAGDL